MDWLDWALNRVRKLAENGSDNALKRVLISANRPLRLRLAIRGHEAIDDD
jgi:hypothetical protein